MGYYIELESITIGKFSERLKSGFLLPGMMVLKANIDENFAQLKGQGISNLAELLGAIKTKKKLEEFAGQSGLPVEYLTVLRREINGFHPKPIALAKFKDIKGETVERLGALGIKNSKDLFDWVLTPYAREELAAKVGIEYGELMSLTSLCDLARIRWVGPTFANFLLKAGFESVSDVASTPYEELYGILKKLNETDKIYKGKLSVGDMELCVKAAAELPADIEY